MNVMNEVLDKITLFEPQKYENMTLIGLSIPDNDNLDLMSLEIGLSMGLVEITECESGATVSQVKVVNKAVTPLLLLDGEEIIGSMQNRIINSTIIVPAKSEKTIPVSCTEHGRWNYNSTKFHYSNHMATSRVRRDKLNSVTQELRNSLSFKSNQGEVWRNIADTERDLKVSTDTGALHDSFNKKRSDIEEYRTAFKLHDNQNGLIVYINGQLVGFELIYNSTRYKEYHSKLVESYILDAISKQNEEYEEKDIVEDEFMDKFRELKAESYDSVGLGVDYRIENNEITGSAVLYEDNLINASFFAKKDGNIKA